MVLRMSDAAAPPSSTPSSTSRALGARLAALSMRVRLVLLGVLIVPCVACDQATKVAAMTSTTPSFSKTVLDIFVVRAFLGDGVARNPGAFLGLGDKLPEGARTALFLGFTSLLLLGTAIYVVRAMARGEMQLVVLIGVALLFAGGVGNLIDRMIRDGLVVDFVQLGLRAGSVKLQTGVFNVADVQIMAGAIMVALSSLRRRREPPSSTTTTPPAPA